MPHASYMFVQFCSTGHICGGDAFPHRRSVRDPERKSAKPVHPATNTVDTADSTVVYCTNVLVNGC